jgi:hypothetical protein
MLPKYVFKMFELFDVWVVFSFDGVCDFFVGFLADVRGTKRVHVAQEVHGVHTQEAQLRFVVFQVLFWLDSVDQGVVDV